MTVSPLQPHPPLPCIMAGPCELHFYFSTWTSVSGFANAYIPCFIALSFTVLHRCCRAWGCFIFFIFLTYWRQDSTSKKMMTHFIDIEPTPQYLQSMPEEGSKGRLWGGRRKKKCLPFPVSVLSASSSCGHHLRLTPPPPLVTLAPAGRCSPSEVPTLTVSPSFAQSHWHQQGKPLSWESWV